ncbi:zinc-binding dehydrogenase [Leptobacterium flavescens]|uniref:Zinc-binding dehydrogenase n=1 Tax=Leptobacterium flavescens TaxID=472055 RepID=A0A6P0URA0_9FLAO|nr:NAD(P)-dependent alcohol dehydrogenase [Leptobacterium flavescens]NER15040.1 zinc-binding dehydrogenase [Leptobacterium flavescens]
MKAIVFDQYGPPEVLQLKEVKKPVPKEHQVLIRVHATTVTAGDCEIRAFKFPLLYWLPLRLMFGFFKPRIKVLGQELAGVIEAVGNKVNGFKTGDPVFAATTVRMGAYAEYICLPGNATIALKPEEVSFDKAAIIPTGGLNALHYLRKADPKKGEKILIIGGGGNFGSFAIQLAKYFGLEVTAVDSAEKLEMMRSIGADHVIDYSREDCTEKQETYDIIFDLVGKSSFSACIRALKVKGRYIMATPVLSKVIKGMFLKDKKVISQLAKYKVEDLDYLAQLMEEGKIKAVIDRSYPLEQTAEAHRYVESGYKKGNIAIDLKHLIQKKQ